MSFDPRNYATYIITEHMTKKVPVADLVKQVQKTASLTGEQLRRVVEETNNMLYHKLYNRDKLSVLNMEMAKAASKDKGLKKAAEILPELDGYEDLGPGTPVQGEGGEFVFDPAIEELLEEEELRRLEEGLGADTVNNVFQLMDGVDGTAEDAAQMLLQKQASLKDIYVTVKEHAPNVKNSIMRSLYNKIELYKYAFEEDPMAELFSGREIRPVDTSSPFVAKLKWLNELYDDTNANMDAMHAVSAKRTKKEG